MHGSYPIVYYLYNGIDKENYGFTKYSYNKNYTIAFAANARLTFAANAIVVWFLL